MHRFLADSRHALPAGQVVGLEFGDSLVRLGHVIAGVSDLHVRQFGGRTLLLPELQGEGAASRGCGRSPVACTELAGHAVAFGSRPIRRGSVDTRRMAFTKDRIAVESDMRSASESLCEQSSVRGLCHFTCGNAPDMAWGASACSPLLWQRSVRPPSSRTRPACQRRCALPGASTSRLRNRPCRSGFGAARPPVNTQHRTPHSIASSPSGTK